MLNAIAASKVAGRAIPRIPTVRVEHNFETLRTIYVQHLQLRNFSALGIKQVEQYIRLFTAYLKGNDISSVHQVSADTFEQYKAYLSAYQSRKATPLSLNTIRARVFAVQRWFRFLRKRGILSFDTIAGVKAPPRVRLLPRGVMTPEEIRKVMAQPDLRTVLGYRDRAIMETLYSTGVRAAELAGLQVADLDLNKKTARVRNGKGAKERFVLLSTPCIRFLERYIQTIRSELAEGIRPAGNNWLKKYRTGGDTLFLSMYGAAITKTWLAAMMKRYIRQAGIDRPISPVHGFRHSLATHLMESGMDVRYVQAILGHSSINSTQIYTHVERKSLQKQLKGYHPSGRKAKFQPFVGEDGHD
ncbi:MAG: tyrosine-type recombinase/integrase [Patescibacteria group bacterium]|jgi:integrase/recombinase XerD